jgi:hypothetical protein
VVMAPALTGLSGLSGQLPITAQRRYRGRVLADGALAYWRLGEASGTVARDERGTYPGAYEDTPTLGAAGAILHDVNTAVTFNGTSEFVTVPYNAALNSAAFSVEIWAFPTGGAGAFRGAIGNRSGGVLGWILYAGDDNVWQFWINDGGLAGSMVAVVGGTVTLNVWTHLVATFDGVTARLIINGVAVASATPTYTPNAEADLTIGLNEEGGTFYFPGKLDEAAVYGAALTEAQALAHYTLGGPAPSYFFLDQFTTPEAAPLATPRTAEPGPGTLTVVDTNNRISIASGQLVINGVTAAADRVASTATVARKAGRALVQFHPEITSYGATGGSTRMGLSTSATDATLTNGIDLNVSTFRIKSASSVIDTVTATSFTLCWYAFMMRATGGFVLRRQAAAGLFTLEWVYALSNAALYHKIYLNTAETRNFKVDPWAIMDFGAPLSSDAGIATTLTATPADGATATMRPNAVVEFTWTVATGQTLELDVRRTDANNRWVIRCSQAGSTMKLIQIQAGVETERASSATTFTDATVHRIVAICSENTIRTWEGLSSTDALTAKANYSSASFNNTATGVAVNGFVTGANLIAWPRYITLPGV